MKPKILIAGFLLFLSLASCSNDRPVWETACTYMKEIYSCYGVAAPKVEYVELDDGWNGRYKGGDTLYISKGLSQYESKSAEFHEIIHYLQLQHGALTLPGQAKNVCRNEDEAYALTDIYRRVLGLDLKYDGWWAKYVFCWRYYAPPGTSVWYFDIPDGPPIILFKQPDKPQ